MRFFARSLSPLTAGTLTLVLATSCFARQPASASSDPWPTEANITRLTTELLESSQFSHRRFDADMAATFVERYVDALDGSRSLFLQSDVDEFARERSKLPEAMRDAGDTSLAQTIYQRFLTRLQVRNAYIEDALRSSVFDFSGHDVYAYDREHAPHPRTLDEAHKLWEQQLRAEYLEEKLSDKKPAEIAITIAKNHAQQLATMKALTSDEVLDVYLNALVHLYDPHSDYLGHEEMESFAIAMKLSLAGIGATLETADGECKIRELVPGGPAARGGVLKPGDRIVAVAQVGKEPVDIANMPLGRAVELIRGPKGSTVTLSIVPAAAADGSSPVQVSVTRDDIKLEDQEAKARIVDVPRRAGGALRLGVIELPSFYADAGDHGGAGKRSATADVARLLRKLKEEGVRGVALDLRHNGGGSLEEAISLTGLFIKKGPVVQTRDQAGAIHVDADEDPSVLYDGPLVVLTSRFSASASEIVAGALQDYGRAVIVGDASTFGKGTVQNVLPFDQIMDKLGLAHSFDPGALKLTTMKFYRPSGASTQLRGVTSDIVVPSDTDLGDVSESAMKNPLPWDDVPLAPHENLDRVRPYLASLKSRSAERVAANVELREVHEDAIRLRTKLATKSISLNEAERRQERGQEKATRQKREEEERSLQAFWPLMYRITLENASAPGLPAPEPAASAPATVGAHGDADREDAMRERTSAEEAVMEEGERVLGDYVELLRRADKGTASPSRVSASDSRAPKTRS